MLNLAGKSAMFWAQVWLLSVVIDSGPEVLQAADGLDKLDWPCGCLMRPDLFKQAETSVKNKLPHPEVSNRFSITVQSNTLTYTYGTRMRTGGARLFNWIRIIEII